MFCLRIALTCTFLCSLGCTPGEAPPAGDSAQPTLFRFRAVGQEPGWLLEIDSQKEIRFSYDYGQKTATTPVPQPTDSSGAQVWHAMTEGNDLRIVIVRTPCEDAMSGQPYPATVTVTLNGQDYRGCGGPTDAQRAPGPSA